MEESGQRELFRSRSTADRRLSLSHEHVVATTGEFHGGGETVGSGADDHDIIRLCHGANRGTEGWIRRYQRPLPWVWPRSPGDEMSSWNTNSG